MGLGIDLKRVEIVVTYNQRIVERNDILRRVKLFSGFWIATVSLNVKACIVIKI